MAGTRRVTLREASEELGVSVEAVRKRVKRDSLRSDKDPDGRVYVYLDASPPASHPELQVENSERGELVEELRDRIRYLERQVEEERNARYRADELLARLMERTQLEAPSEPRQSPETVEEEPERAAPHSATGGAQEATQRRSWWRRVFGG
jgi:hypothetical protein